MRQCLEVLYMEPDLKSVPNKYQPLYLGGLTFFQILPCLFCLLNFSQAILSAWNNFLYLANSNPLFRYPLKDYSSDLF